MIWESGLGEPKAVAVMLTADRQAYTERALICFLQQRYTSKRLFILDTGQRAFEFPWWADFGARQQCSVVHAQRKPGQSLGELRNVAAELCRDQGDILMHWDSDDWSSPLRITDQVQHLLSHPGIDLTGYESMYFYRRADHTAWRYYNKGYCIGTSMAYWWKAWRASGGFPALAVGEDTEWQKHMKRDATHSGPPDNPYMIAELHPGSTLAAGTISRIAQTGDPRADVWHAVPEARDMLEMKLGYTRLPAYEFTERPQ